MEGEILLYQTEEGQPNIEVRLENETVWLTQQQMADLFQTDRSGIVKHIKNIYQSKELEENATCAKNAQVQKEGNRTVQRVVPFFNLDVIISVGYRVNSHRGTQFRIWATQRLREYLVKGFTLDDQRLKSGNQMNYFDELLERIRDIRSSERVFYQKVKDIFSTSIDYEQSADLTQGFYANMQNKLHWAVHQHTAAELIYARANANVPNMGLTTWAGPQIRKSDITIAKNYLEEDELRTLNLLVEQYLAFAEAQAHAKRPMYMRDWLKKLHDILSLNERAILEDAGKISRKLADELANNEYEKFKTRQISLISDPKVSLLEEEIDRLKRGKISKK
jgi:hypothetical protein